jgi:C-terminal processing protease CtpA/Prc
MQAEESESKKIEEFLNLSKDCQALIIDIRGNGGGSELYWKENIVPRVIGKTLLETRYLFYRGGEYTEKLLRARGMNGYSDCLSINKIDQEELSKAPRGIKEQFKYYSKIQYSISPKDSIDFKGNIYLLVNRQVYSSAESFAVFAKSTGFATLIGETTRGDGIGIDPALCSLPNSGYLFRYSQAMGLTSDGTCNEEFKTQPDIEIYNAYKDTTLAKDVVIKRVLQLEGIE